MKTLRFHEHGGPTDVLWLEDAPLSEPGAGEIHTPTASCAPVR